MPPVKTAAIDEWDPPTLRDAFARLMPFTVDRVTKEVRENCRAARSHWERADSLFDEIEAMLR